jgi:hypothetical protein
MNSLYSKADWRPPKGWRQYRVREAIGVEIEFRSGEDKSLIPDIIKKLEGERQGHTIQAYAKYLFDKHVKAGRVEKPK